MKKAELKEHKVPEHLLPFFNNVADLKAFVKKKYEETKDPILKEIFDKIHSFFTTTKE